MIEKYSGAELNPLHSIINLTNLGFILGKDFELGEKGEPIIFQQTHQKVSEKIVERQQQLSSSNQNENAPISMKAMLERIATKACGDPKYFENILERAAIYMPLMIEDNPYLALAYMETLAEGTENKFSELSKIPFRNYMLNEVLDTDNQIELLTNLDNYSISPEETQKKAIEEVLIDIASTFSSDLEDEVISSIRKGLMPINAFQFIDKVWTSEKVPIKKIIEFMEKSSIK